jgi:hypothetical protein
MPSRQERRKAERAAAKRAPARAGAPEVIVVNPLGDWQGLTLVHLSAQLEPCMTQENTLHTQKTPYTLPSTPSSRATQSLRTPSPTKAAQVELKSERV